MKKSQWGCHAPRRSDISKVLESAGRMIRGTHETLVILDDNLGEIVREIFPVEPEFIIGC
ncbi:MAG: hypothetical protein HYU64_04450 [Armatimonadetes bacterium]|nr:hypothetical protein [Armatimonadota bacterium]